MGGVPYELPATDPRNPLVPLRRERLHLKSNWHGIGGAENAGVENAGVDHRGGKCRSGKCRSDNVWKAEI